MNYTVVDFETASHVQGSICQAALIIVRDHKEIISRSFYLDPECEFESRFSKLHGITAQTVAGAPTFPRFLDLIAKYLNDETVISHGSFDGRALASAAARYRVPLPRLKWIDTVAVGRAAWPDLSNHQLPTLAQAMNLSFSHHDAMEDAIICHHAFKEGLRRTRTEMRHWVGQQPAASAERGPGKAAWAGKSAKPLPPQADGLFMGKSVVFTGELSFERAEAYELAARAGFSVKSSVSPKTHFVISGTNIAHDGVTGKELKARELQEIGVPIQIIGESEFLALLKKAGVQR